MEKAKLINVLTASGQSTSILQKPDKLYLENTNLQFALSPQTADKGTLRETFFLTQQLNAGNQVRLHPKGDFMVNEQFVFEVGGRTKNSAQNKTRAECLRCSRRHRNRCPEKNTAMAVWDEVLRGRTNP